MEPRRLQSQAVGRVQWLASDSEIGKVRPVVLTSAACRAEQVGGRSALVTVPAHHVGSTPALATAGLTHRAEGTLGVTLARWWAGQEEVKCALLV